jgi:hypothetical protein
MRELLAKFCASRAVDIDVRDAIKGRIWSGFHRGLRGSIFLIYHQVGVKNQSTINTCIDSQRENSEY